MSVSDVIGHTLRRKKRESNAPLSNNGSTECVIIRFFRNKNIALSGYVCNISGSVASRCTGASWEFAELLTQFVWEHGKCLENLK
jgi:hypothetical protein